MFLISSIVQLISEGKLFKNEQPYLFSSAAANQTMRGERKKTQKEERRENGIVIFKNLLMWVAFEIPRLGKIMKFKCGLPLFAYH